MTVVVVMREMIMVVSGSDSAEDVLDGGGAILISMTLH